LLALGLKKVTADCVVSSIGSKDRLIHTGEPIYVMESLSSKRIPNYPAWSLHRLIEMIPSEIPMEDYYLILGVSFNCVYYADNEYAEVFQSFDGNTYSCIINCIQWLIGKGYFYKEYLEE
jgi:hypothetical protein